MLVLCLFLFHKNFDSMTNFYAILRFWNIQIAFMKDILTRNYVLTI